MKVAIKEPSMLHKLSFFLLPTPTMLLTLLINAISKQAHQAPEVMYYSNYPKE